MASPLEIRLKAQVDASSDPDVRAALLAEIACYLARVGEFDEAERLRKQLREVYGDGRCIAVSILLMTLDALLLYFKELSPAARDRMARANLIAVASGSLRWTCLTSAWLAHIDFNLNQFELMVREVSAALDALSGDDGTAECRVALVLGDAFLFCGQIAPSQRWYERARLLANRLGDQAAIGALTYNRAALRVAMVRLGAIDAEVDVGEVASVWAEIKSASNYQIVARAKSLEHLIGSARVGALILQKNYPQALQAIDDVLATGSVPAASGELLLLKADRALCLAAMGDRHEAGLEVTAVAECGLEDLSPDDAALVSWSLSQASWIVNGDTVADGFVGLARTRREEHRTRVDDLLARISRYSDPQSTVAQALSCFGGCA